MLRSRGVGYGAGRSVYAKRDRERWLDALPEPTRPLAKLLYEERDALCSLEMPSAYQLTRRRSVMEIGAWLTLTAPAWLAFAGNMT